MSCWVNTISWDHVETGREGGFTQADHGRSTGLRRLRRGDGLVFYSPRTARQGGEIVQAFTALGVVTDDEPYQVEISPDFRPWRRTVRFEEAAFAPIRPLLDRLSFTAARGRHWGIVFRRGLFPVAEADFAVIAEAMRRAR